MEAYRKVAVLSVDNYLAGEQQSELRHEFIGGEVYAMAGGSEEHNLISLNLASALRTATRDRGCRVFMADMKVQLVLRGEDVFYYPDVMVVCDPRDTDRLAKRYPKLLIEVLSEATERIDRREKLWSYTQIETLEEYVLVEQDRRGATVYRRSRGWQPEALKLPGEPLRLDSVGFTMDLASVYEGVAVPTT